jgi:hypothetical protein
MEWKDDKLRLQQSLISGSFDSLEEAIASFHEDTADIIDSGMKLVGNPMTQEINVNVILEEVDD